MFQYVDNSSGVFAYSRKYPAAKGLFYWVEVEQLDGGRYRRVTVSLVRSQVLERGQNAIKIGIESRLVDYTSRDFPNFDTETFREMCNQGRRFKKPCPDWAKGIRELKGIYKQDEKDFWIRYRQEYGDGRWGLFIVVVLILLIMIYWKYSF